MYKRASLNQKFNGLVVNSFSKQAGLLSGAAGAAGATGALGGAAAGARASGTTLDALSQLIGQNPYGAAGGLAALGGAAALPGALKRYGKKRVAAGLAGAGLGGLGLREYLAAANRANLADDIVSSQSPIKYYAQHSHPDFPESSIASLLDEGPLVSGGNMSLADGSIRNFSLPDDAFQSIGF